MSVSEHKHIYQLGGFAFAWSALIKIFKHDVMSWQSFPYYWSFMRGATVNW